MKTVSVIGTLHDMHETTYKNVYSLNDLGKAIRKIAPEVILAEIWPDWKERYRYYRDLPDFELEYKSCIYPLAEEMNIKIIELDYGSIMYANDFRKWEKDKSLLVEYGDIKYELYYRVSDVIFNSSIRFLKMYLKLIRKLVMILCKS